MDKKSSFIDIKTVVISEPRIELIKRQLESLLSIVELEHEGKPVKVDGFSLKSPLHWRVPKNEDPGEIIRYLGRMRPCPSRCEFCYIRGNPPEVIFNTSYRVSMEELRTRMKYYLSDDPFMLYHACFDCEEIFSAPGALDFLREIRERTSQIFVIYTGGRFLTGEFIEKLQKLHPIFLNVSLNLSDGEKRKKLMGDLRADIGIKALPLLRAAKMPYVVSIVGWFDLEPADIEETIRYAADNDAIFIDIGLGGYTRLNPPLTIKDTFAWWGELAALAERMRTEVGCPVLTVPALFEENLRETGWREARVSGVVKHSPAYFAGMREGDVVKNLAGLSFRSRPHLLKIFRRAEGMGITVNLTVSRQGQETSLSLDPAKSAFPYVIGGHFNLSYGLIIPEGLTESDVQETMDAIRRNNARNPLIVTTALMKPSLVEALTEYDEKAASQVSLCVVKSSFFGGNIVIGDLMTIGDIIKSAGDFIEKSHIKPDLIIVPGSGFRGWRRDFTGRSYLDIEREFDIPVAIINNEPIFY